MIINHNTHETTFLRGDALPPPPADSRHRAVLLVRAAHRSVASAEPPGPRRSGRGRDFDEPRTHPRSERGRALRAHDSVLRWIGRDRRSLARTSIVRVPKALATATVAGDGLDRTGGSRTRSRKELQSYRSWIAVPDALWAIGVWRLPAEFCQLAGPLLGGVRTVVGSHHQDAVGLSEDFGSRGGQCT